MHVAEPARRVDLREAYAALGNGEPQRTEQAARMRLLEEPDDEAALTLLGLALQAQHRHVEAVQALTKLARLCPRVPQHWNNLGLALRAAGDLEHAEDAHRRACELAPGDAAVQLNHGYLLMQRGKFAAARTCLLESVRCAPELAEPRIRAAFACYECGDNLSAEELIAAWPQWCGLDAPQRCDLAWLLFLLDHADVARGLLESARAEPETSLQATVRLVLLLERSNRVEEATALAATLPAAEAVDEELRHDITEARAALAARDADAGRARRWFERAVDAHAPESRNAALYFALAQACDRTGDADAAMAALHEAHALQLRLLGSLSPHLLPQARPLPLPLRALDANRVAAWPRLRSPAAEESPIFVVGFPRSGTTLLEQMLDAHPQLASIDERDYLAELADHIEVSLGLRYPDDLDRLTQAQCDRLRATYAARVRATRELRAGQRLVDKNPLNLLHLPLIVRLFPHAPIVLALRHPCDVVLSCYMQNFRLPAFIALCTSLPRLAQGYVNTMQFWQQHVQMLQPRWLPLRHEALLADPPAQLARLGAFVGIEDITPMLGFAEHAHSKGYISTPSYAQVVRPLNSDALGRWRRYAAHMQGALPILQPMIEVWDYDG
ncbi:MAG: sulfotransferase [Dokdonella sp.]